MQRTDLHRLVTAAGIDLAYAEGLVRLPRLLVLAWVLVPALAFARPKVAIAPLDGDTHGDVADIVAAEAADHAKVVTPDRVGQVMDSLGLSTRNKRSVRTLRARLEVDAVIFGQVERANGKRRLELTIAAGKSTSTFELEFTSASSRTFRRQLREELARRIAAAEGGGGDDPDGGDDQAAQRDDDRSARHGRDHDRDRDEGDDRSARGDDDRGTHRDDDRHDDRNSHRDDDRNARRDDDRSSRDDDTTDPGDRHDRHGRVAADDDPDASVRRRRGDDGDRDEDRHHRRHHHVEVPRHPVTQAALWLDAGPAGAHRSLTYATAGGGAPPPPVGTGAFGAEVEAELYPGAFSTLHGAGAGFGLAASFGQSFGLAIRVPGSTVSAPIDEGHYAVGVRYRFTFGQSSLALGADYWAQRDVANRGGLMNATLDMPDVNYTAVAPAVAARFPVSPKTGVLLAAELPLMLSSGPITDGKNFGLASVFAFAGEAALDVALAPHYGLRFAASYDQIGLSFRQPARGVTAASDSTLVGTASFAILY